MGAQCMTGGRSSTAQLDLRIPTLWSKCLQLCWDLQLCWGVARCAACTVLTTNHLTGLPDSSRQFTCTRWLLGVQQPRQQLFGHQYSQKCQQYAITTCS